MKITLELLQTSKSWFSNKKSWMQVDEPCRLQSPYSDRWIRPALSGALRHCLLTHRVDSLSLGLQSKTMKVIKTPDFITIWNWSSNYWVSPKREREREYNTIDKTGRANNRYLPVVARGPCVLIRVGSIHPLSFISHQLMASTKW